MNLSRARFVCAAIFELAFALAGDSPTGSAETAEQIIAAAKKEGDEIAFVAGNISKRIGLRFYAKQQNDFYLQGEAAGLKLKEELAKIMKQ